MSKDQRFCGEILEGCGRRVQDNSLQRDRASQLSFCVDKINRGYTFDSAFKPSKQLDCLTGSCIVGSGEKFGRHATSGGLFTVLEELDNFLALLRFHFLKDL